MTPNSPRPTARWIGLTVALALVGGCRDPEFEEFPWQAGDYDPGAEGASPAPLCPPGSKATVINAHSPHEGGAVDEDVWLVVEVFSYFRCANCADLAVLTKELLHRREDINRHVRFYFHHYPLYGHVSDMNLHASTIAVQDQSNEGFWEVHDWVFENLAADDLVLISPGEIREYARDELGLDMARYDEIYDADETRQFIAWDKEQGVDLGMIGTPGVFICGASLGHWPDLEHEIDSYLP